MSALSIEVPFPVFQDRDGQPLDNGYIWLGVANLNPQTNPVVAYFDKALTIVAPQPLRTINGYVSRAGTPAQVYIDGVNFSILVQDSKGTMVYNFPDGTGISPNSSGISFTGFKGQVGTVQDLADNDGSDWIGFDPAGSGAVARSAQDKMRDTVSVKDFGAVGDGVTDDAAAFNAAIAAAVGEVLVTEGTYLLGSTVTLDRQGIRLVGAGIGRTILKASHSNGPVVRVKAEASGLSYLTIDSTSARISGGAGTNFGILHAGNDSAGLDARTKFGYYTDFEIKNQPNSSMVMVGNHYSSSINVFRIINGAGHGLVFDNGTILGWVNKSRPGLTIVTNGEISDHTGHSILVGGTFVSEDVNLGARLVFTNIDTFRCALAGGIRKSDQNAWLFTESSTVQNCAFGGFVGPGQGAPTVSGLGISGRTNQILNNRFIGVTPRAIVINNETNFSTKDVLIDGMVVAGPSQPSLNPAIAVATGATNITAIARYDVNITTLMSASSTREVMLGDTKEASGNYEFSHLQFKTGFKTGNFISLNNNTVATLDFDDAVRGILVVSGNVSAAQAAVIHFRVGTNLFTTILSATSNVDVTTGVLTGTTGVNGKLTISAAADNKIYIENRLGALYSYQLTLLSSSGGRIV
jgi:hypothetical protein